MVRNIRKAQGITQAQLAKNIGISRPYLSDIENYKHQISGELMIRIAQHLKTNVEEIFFADDVRHEVQSAQEN